MPQGAGLLFAWLMQLLTEIVSNGDVNQVTVQEISKNADTGLSTTHVCACAPAAEAVAPLLIATDNDEISRKLPRIIAVILNDKIAERMERQDALHQVGLHAVCGVC